MVQVIAHRLESSSDNVIGIVNLTFDDKFKMDSIRIIESRKAELGFFLAMPAYKTERRNADDRPVYKDLFHPANKDFIKKLYNATKKSLESGESIEIYRETVHHIGVKAEPINSSGQDNGIRARVTLYVSRENEELADMVIDTVKIRENLKDTDERKIFIAFPSRKTSVGEYKSVCYPVTAASREELFGNIFTAYHKELDKGSESDDTASKDTMKVSDGTKGDRIR